MKLVEIHNIKRSSSYFNEIDKLCFLSKNLYNAALYYIRQKFFETSSYSNYYEVQKDFQNSKNSDYLALPTKVSQQVLMQVHTQFKSFFASLKDYKLNPKKYKGRPKLPKYKDKNNGRNMLVYTNQAISTIIKDSVKLSKTNIVISTKQQDIHQVRIIPQLEKQSYKIEIVYEKKIEDINLDKNNIAAIDLGLANFVSLTFNQQINPILISGGPLKSINSYFNKKLANYKSIEKKTSSLSNKRENKINDFLHKTSRYIINQLVSTNTGVLVVGHNKNQKQEINIGKVNNQNFVSIPFYKFLNMLKYKAELLGIKYIEISEEYTSKCSFLDGETIKKNDKYQGKRVIRGLFETSSGKKINADINGSYNIMKKGIPNCNFTNGIQGVVVHPIKAKLYKNGNIEQTSINH